MKSLTMATITVLLISIGFSPALFAGSHGHAGHHPAPATAEVHQGNATVETVDLKTATLRVDHEPIESLNWPQMVMDLKVKDAGLLIGLERGDRIAFDLEKTDKGFIITRIEKID